VQAPDSEAHATFSDPLMVRDYVECQAALHEYPLLEVVVHELPPHAADEPTLQADFFEARYRELRAQQLRLGLY
jgi:hypothetical protein